MSSRRRILIRTFPPNRNPNPGGILQAWALQRALASLGVEPVTDSTKKNRRGRERPEVLKRAKRLAVRVIVRATRGASPLSREAAVSRANARLLKFARERVAQRPLYSSGVIVDQELVAWPDAFVAGSDQVWNPTYCDVPSFLFDFVPLDDPRPRVAYAASFGSDAPGLTPELIARTTPLARRFSAISVREESAVGLCRELWGVEAVRLIDSTMLLEADDYRAAFREAGVVPPDGGLATYLLDETPDKHRTAEEIGAALGGRHDLWRPTPATMQAFKAEPARYQRPTIETWLATIAGGAAVVTDSYHGAVFSILFNRPFLVFPNKTRGLARFDTLLGIFGLESRVARGDGEDERRMREPIDWERVNARIADERARGLDFLRHSLADVLVEGSAGELR